MKLSLRTSVAAAVLTMAATVGITVATTAPASAGSCSELLSVDGTTTKSTSLTLNHYKLNVTPTARLGASNCFAGFYRSTVYIYKADGTILAQHTAYGSDSTGARSFGTLSVNVYNGTNEIGVGVKTEVYNGSSWVSQERWGWGVKVPNTTFNTATGQNVIAGGSGNSCSGSKPLGYSDWCRLPF